MKVAEKITWNNLKSHIKLGLIPLSQENKFWKHLRRGGGVQLNSLYILLRGNIPLRWNTVCILFISAESDQRFNRTILPPLYLRFETSAHALLVITYYYKFPDFMILSTLVTWRFLKIYFGLSIVHLQSFYQTYLVWNWTSYLMRRLTV